MLFTFPSRYSFTIGRQEYLALEGGPPIFGQGFTCPALLEDPGQPYAYGALTRSGRRSHGVRLRTDRSVPGAWARLARLTTPLPQRPGPWHGKGLGSSPFAHHYLGNLG